MKYAIIEVSGRQVWVEPGRYYDLNKISTEKGTNIVLNRVLFANDTNRVFIGKPYLDNVQITGTVLEHRKGPKIIVYKMRPKKKTRKKQGYRQELTRVLINEITFEKA